MSQKWEPVTLKQDAPVNDAIPFVMTSNMRDAAVMCRLEIEAMRRFRMPEGVEVKEISMQEFLDAREEFRRHL